MCLQDKEKEENQMKKFVSYIHYIMNFYANYFKICRYM